MSRDWDSLNTFSDWSKTLHELLAEATTAIQSGDVGKRVAVQEELNRFIMHSPNTVAGQLDEIAGNAINDIFRTAVDEALASIGSRTAELSKHIKTVNAVAAEAESAAKSMRLETATKVINCATEVIRNLNDLKAAVANTQDEAALASKIDNAVTAIQDLVPSVMAVKGTT